MSTTPERPERRVDLKSRARVVWLEQHYRTVTRWLLVGFIVLAGTVIVALAGMLLLFDRQQDSRAKVLVTICQQQNVEHAAIRKFVIERAPHDRRAVEKAFPIVPDCEAYAKRQVAIDATP